MWRSKEKPRLAALPGARRQATHDLSRCAGCGSCLVQPVDWFEQSPGHMHVSLRCPECERTSDGTFDSETLAEFEAQLDRGEDALVAELRRLEQSIFEHEATSVVRALRSDAILPMDF